MTESNHKSPEPQSFIVMPKRLPPKKIVDVLAAGSNAGGLGNLSAYAAFNASSTGMEVRVTSVDIVPGRAEILAKRAETMGIITVPIQARAEDIITSAAPGPVIIQVDRASAVARLLREALRMGRSVLAYLIVLLPSRRLIVIMVALSAHDLQEFEGAIAFFDGLAKLSERRGSNGIFGATANPAHQLLEQPLRAMIARHTEQNLIKLTAGLELNSMPIEISGDGQTSISLHVVRRERWADVRDLTAEVLAHPNTPIARGERFSVAEITSDGIRVHDVVHRHDGLVRVERSTTLDRQTIEQLEAEERRRLETEERNAKLAAFAFEAMSRATRETLTPRNPARTTD